MTTTTRPRSQRLLAATALTVLLAGGAAACSGSGSKDAKEAKATTTTSDAPAKTTVTTTAPTRTTAAGPTDTTDAGETTTTEASDDGDRSKQAYIDAFVKGFDSSEDLIPTKQSECVAEKIIGVVGLDAMRTSGLSPEDFASFNGDDFPKSLGIDKDKANEMYDQFEACDVNLGDAFIKALSGEGSLSAKEKACLADKITDDSLRASFVSSFLGDGGESDPLDSATECFDGLGDGPTANSVVPATPSTVG